MPAKLVTGRFDAKATGTSVDYRVLVPDIASGPLPLILHLHGAMSSAAALETARPSYERAWQDGILPPAIVGCPSTPTQGGFYIDHPEGAAWERLAGTEFPAHLARRFALAERRVAYGASMGGYGALKVAFREPNRWLAVAALCPVIFPAEAAQAVPERNRPSILAELNRAMGTDPVSYASNCVPALARRRRDALRAASQHIFFDCGDADEFNLHDGALYLHRLLHELGVPHDFRSVAGAAHADAQALPRQDHALAFLGRALSAAQS